MVDYVDPDESGDVPFWRINEHIGKIVVLAPLTEHPEKTDFGEGNVIDCYGGVYDGTAFTPIGNVRIFQEVLQKKLRAALNQGAVVIAKLVRPGVAYDLRPVDAETRSKVGAAWDAVEQEPPEQPTLDDSF